jgi:hypothetical protein
MPLAQGITDPLVYLNEILYMEVLRNAYPQDICEAHAFVTRKRIPLYLLVQTNTTLANKGIYFNNQLDNRKSHIEKLRAEASLLYFPS